MKFSFLIVAIMIFVSSCAHHGHHGSQCKMNGEHKCHYMKDGKKYDCNKEQCKLKKYDCKNKQCKYKHNKCDKSKCPMKKKCKANRASEENASDEKS